MIFGQEFDNDQRTGSSMRSSQCISATEKAVLVIGGISLNSLTHLYVIRGAFTVQRYRDKILQPIVLPALQEMGSAAQFLAIPRVTAFQFAKICE